MGSLKGHVLAQTMMLLWLSNTLLIGDYRISHSTTPYCNITHRLYSSKPHQSPLHSFIPPQPPPSIPGSCFLLANLSAPQQRIYNRHNTFQARLLLSRFNTQYQPPKKSWQREATLLREVGTCHQCCQKEKWKAAFEKTKAIPKLASPVNLATLLFYDVIRPSIGVVSFSKIDKINERSSRKAICKLVGGWSCDASVPQHHAHIPWEGELRKR
jgi:hypothetical protein